MFQLTEDHIELTLATNYFGPSLLTLLLQVGGGGGGQAAGPACAPLACCSPVACCGLLASAAHPSSLLAATSLLSAPLNQPSQDTLVRSAPSRVVNMASVGEFAADMFKNIDW